MEKKKYFLRSESLTFCVDNKWRKREANFDHYYLNFQFRTSSERSGWVVVDLPNQERILLLLKKWNEAINREHTRVKHRGVPNEAHLFVLSLVLENLLLSSRNDSS